MDMSVTYEQLANKLYIFTIGSPRYLPAGLIPSETVPQPPKLLNVYYFDDPVVNSLKFVPTFIFAKRIPQNLSLYKEPYYDPINAIYIVNETNAMVCLAHTSADYDLKLREANKTYYKHISPYMLLSLFKNDKHLFHLHNMDFLHNDSTPVESDNCKVPKFLYKQRGQQKGKWFE